MIAAVFRPTAEALVFAIALVGWTGTTRIIRGQTLSIRGLDYVVSAKAMGASPWRIMFVHIAPNLISVTAIALMRGIGNLMLAEATLSFLGLGVQPPQATWGNMLTKSQQFFNLGGHLVLAPGLAIWVTVLCLYVIGDGIRDAFDPTMTK
jgi:peptide/nickel transport system permease protein